MNTRASITSICLIISTTQCVKTPEIVDEVPGSASTAEGSNGPSERSKNLCLGPPKETNDTYPCSGAEARGTPVLLQSGSVRIGIQPIVTSGEYVLFREILGDSINSPRALSRIKADGTGYEVVAGPKDALDIDKFYADDREYYVVSDSDEIYHRPAIGGAWTPLIQRGAFLGLDEQNVYVLAVDTGRHVLAISRSDESSRTLLEEPNGTNFMDGRVHAGLLYLRDLKGSMYRLSLSEVNPTLEKIGPGCPNFVVTDDGVLCAGGSKLSLLDVQTGQYSVAFDAAANASTDAQVRSAELSLFITQADGADVYAYSNSIGTSAPIWRFDLSEQQAHPFVCNRQEIESMAVTKTHVFWHEHRDDVDSYDCLFAVER